MRTGADEVGRYGQLLFAIQGVSDLAKQLRQLDVERAADRRQQLRRRFLLTPFNLGRNRDSCAMPAARAPSLAKI